ncbi:hypothetical protein WN48_05600 [Eufriesea mexicana]|uniref:Uncharacterized protein n=1 Tax=Eufriesea mexicana TaxID=516756 RepID=A0A310SDA9_9HYME|nr:hypothetical protein WN48_05600 [Eufriesea mexicana]
MYIRLPIYAHAIITVVVRQNSRRFQRLWAAGIGEKSGANDVGTLIGVGNRHSLPLLRLRLPSRTDCGKSGPSDRGTELGVGETSRLSPLLRPRVPSTGNGGKSGASDGGTPLGVGETDTLSP